MSTRRLQWAIVGIIVLQCLFLYHLQGTKPLADEPTATLHITPLSESQRTESPSPTLSEPPVFDLGMGAHEFGHKAEENVNLLDEVARTNFIEVFLVPHSHCDAGWLKTFDEYYQDQVRHILSTVTAALKSAPHRKFSWVEVAFLEKWWAEQSNPTKATFANLFERQQLEFLMGGWVSHDEATVSYMQAINQMTEGHRFLQEQFGPDAIPRIGWQIDPFGLSQVTASLFSQMCFDANAAWRTRQGVGKDEFIQQQQLEFIWRGSDTLQASSDVLLHLLPWSYTSPAQFLFENQPKGLLQPEEVERLAHELVNSFKVRAQAYSSKLLMWPWGHDFQFVDAHRMFDEMDKLLNYINSHSEFNVHVKYATPSEYFDALHKEERSYSLVQKDFLPYGPSAMNWWTGFYTSRPALKGHCREMDQMQRTAEIVYAWAYINHRHGLSAERWSHLFKKLEAVRRVQGIMQHHDAITGTMKEAVLHDYRMMLATAAGDTMEVLDATSTLVTARPHLHAVRPDEVISVVDSPREHPQSVLLFNNLGWNRMETVQLFVDVPHVEVMDASTGLRIKSSVLPPSLKANGKMSSYRLFFRATARAVGYHSYLLYHSPERTFEDVEVTESVFLLRSWDRSEMPGIRIVPQPRESFTIENEFLQVRFDVSGAVSAVQSKSTGLTMPLRKENWEYHSDIKWDNHYTFKATGQKQQSTEGSTVFYVKSTLVEEVEHQVNAELTQRFTLRDGEEFLSSSDFIRPSRTGENYVARFITSLQTSGVFFTDDSGFELVRRQYQADTIYSGNYYPTVYSSVLLEEGVEEPHQLSFIFDRTHGVTSPQSGIMDVMMHRNAIQAMGNGEPLNDMDKVEIRSWLLLDESHQREKLSMRMNFALTPVLALSAPDASSTAEGAFFSQELPEQVFLMNLERFTENQDLITLRVSNIVQQQSSPQVSVDKLFVHPSDVQLQGVEERTLSLNQPHSQCKRHHWHHTNETTHPFQYGETLPHPMQDHSSLLSPLSIRSFLLQFTSPT